MKTANVRAATSHLKKISSMLAILTGCALLKACVPSSSLLERSAPAAPLRSDCKGANSLIQGFISSLTLDAVTAFAASTREHDILPRILISIPGGETTVWNMTIPQTNSVKVRGGLCWDDYEWHRTQGTFWRTIGDLSKPPDGVQIAIDDISAVVEANFQVRGLAGVTLFEGRSKIALSGSMTIFANLRYLDGQAIDICDGDFGIDSFHVDMAGAFKGTTESAEVQAVISNIMRPLVRENAASMVCEGRVSPMLRFLGGPSVEVDWSSMPLMGGQKPFNGLASEVQSRLRGSPVLRSLLKTIGTSSPYEERREAALRDQKRLAEIGVDAPFGEDRFVDISPYDNSIGAKMIDTDYLASVDGGVTEALAGTTRAGTYLWGIDTKESMKFLKGLALTNPLIEEVALGGKASFPAVECHDFAATEPQSRSRLRALYRGEKGAEAPAALCTASQRLSPVCDSKSCAFYLGNHTDGQVLAYYRGSKVGDLPGTSQFEIAATSSELALGPPVPPAPDSTPLYQYGVIQAWRDDKGRPHPKRFEFSRWERRPWPFDGEVVLEPMLELRLIASPWWWGGNSKSAKEEPLIDYRVLRAGSDDVVAAVGEARPLAPDHSWRDGVDLLGLFALFLFSQCMAEGLVNWSFDSMAVRAFYAWNSAKEFGYREISKANKAIKALANGGIVQNIA